MRKLTILILVSLSILTYSCKDDLNISPFDEVEEGKALQTPTDFTNAIRGVYSRLIGPDGEYGARKNILPDVLSDNLIVNQNGRRSLLNYYEFQLDANSTWSGLLLYAYGVVDRSNRIINNIDNLSDGDFKNNILGQAKALRALAHYDAAITYAPSFTAVNPDDVNSGIPIKREVDASAKPFRATLNETFNFIIEELVAAKGLVADDRAAVSSGFINKAAVSALLARVYLYKGDNVKAQAEAQEAKALLGSEDLAIGSITEFPKIWTDNSAGNAGVVFKLLLTEQDRITPGVEFNQTVNGEIRSEYVPTFEFYALYTEKDVRKNTYFSTAPFSGITYNHIVKYYGRPGGSAGIVDIKVIRGAEVYLTLAEAASENGDDVTALAALDAVRSRRYADFVSPGESGDALLQAILLERRLELAFEGFRFYDLKRLGLPLVRSGTTGENADGTGLPAPVSTQLIQGNSFRFTLPVPTAERQANPNFAQSPNY